MIEFDVMNPGVQLASQWSGVLTPATVRDETQVIWWQLIVGAVVFAAGIDALDAALPTPPPMVVVTARRGRRSC